MSETPCANEGPDTAEAKAITKGKKEIPIEDLIRLILQKHPALECMPPGLKFNSIVEKVLAGHGD